MSISSSHRRKSGFNPLLALLLVVFGVIGVVVTLHFTGQVQIDAIDRLLGRNEVKAAEASGAAFPVAVRTLQPGHRIGRADLWNRDDNFYQFVRVPKDIVDERWIQKTPSIEGRVLAGTKLPGKVFIESDFLPKGSASGPIALVPDGMTLISLDASKIDGLEDLNYKDRFMLIVSEPVDSDLIQEAEKILESQSGSKIERRLELAKLKETAHQRVLVRDGVMIKAIERGTVKKDKQVSVAISPDEFNALVSAMTLDRDVFCAMRSGKAGADEAFPIEIPDQEEPIEKLEWLWESVSDIEFIAGTERSTVTVPKKQ